MHDSGASRYQVHICLYSHHAPPFHDIFTPSSTTDPFFTSTSTTPTTTTTTSSTEETTAAGDYKRYNPGGPRTLYEIARKVDRPLDVRFSPLSLLWLDLPVAAHGTPKKSKAQHPPRHASMSPDLLRSSREGWRARDASSDTRAGQHRHPEAPLPSSLTSTAVKSSAAASTPSTPIARFVKESSFRVDEDDNDATGSHRQTRSGANEIAFGIVHLFRDDAAIQDVANAKTKTSLEDDSGTILAVLGVPAHIGPADFLRLIEPAAEAISQVRMIREEVTNRCMVLLKFRDAANAEEFHRMYADQPFDPLEEPNELCRVVYVTKVTVSTTSTLPFAYPLLANSDPWPIIHHDQQDSSSSHTTSSGYKMPVLAELPTCPVCLERMDASVTGLMTVTCQHTFHCSCLSRWSDSRCPVCRYTQSRLIKKGQHAMPSFVPENGRCTVCGTGGDLWVCLICATVGCGRYKAGHAHRHYHETGHLYSLELETQRVWDYAGDGYVHRLIQSKADFTSIDEGGPTPKGTRDSAQSAALPASKPSSSLEASGSSTGRSGATVEMEEKMEALGLEYSHLLSTQLESQRAFYENQVHAYQEKAEQAETGRQSLHAALGEAHQERDDLRARVDALTSRSEHVHTNMDASLKRIKKLDEELRGERVMSKGLVARIDKLMADDKERQSEVAALRAENVELKEQVRDLMFFVEARAKVEHEGGEELRGGGVEVGKSKKKATPNPQQQHGPSQTGAAQTYGNTLASSSSSHSKSKKKKSKGKGKSTSGAATGESSVAVEPPRAGDSEELETATPPAEGARGDLAHDHAADNAAEPT